MTTPRLNAHRGEEGEIGLPDVRRRIRRTMTARVNPRVMAGVENRSRDRSDGEAARPSAAKRRRCLTDLKFRMAMTLGFERRGVGMVIVCPNPLPYTVRRRVHDLVMVIGKQMSHRQGE